MSTLKILKSFSLLLVLGAFVISFTGCPTPETPTPPGTPTELSVGSPTTTSLVITWTAVTGATGYLVYIDTASEGSFSTSQAIEGATTTSYTWPNLTDGTTYYFKVAAVNGAGASDLSTVASGATISAGSVTLTAPATDSFTSGVVATYLATSDGFWPDDSTLIVANFMLYPGIMIVFPGQTTGTFTIGVDTSIVMYGDASGQDYIAMDSEFGQIGSGAITVTAYGAVGELIEGTFDVLADVWDMVNEQPSGTTTAVTGSFSVTRQADQ